MAWRRRPPPKHSSRIEAVNQVKNTDAKAELVMNRLVAITQAIDGDQQSTETKSLQRRAVPKAGPHKPTRAEVELAGRELGHDFVEWAQEARCKRCYCREAWTDAFVSDYIFSPATQHVLPTRFM